MNKHNFLSGKDTTNYLILKVLHILTFRIFLGKGTINFLVVHLF